VVHREPDNIDAREQCLYGAYLSAVAFASSGSGLHHKICHALGGGFNLPQHRRMPRFCHTSWLLTPMRHGRQPGRIASAFGAAGTTRRAQFPR